MEEAVVHGSGVHLATAVGELDSSRVWENTGILPALIALITAQAKSNVRRLSGG